jgi:hypothetical protein
MTTPTITLYPDTLPAKGQAQAAFDTNVDNFLTWQTATSGPELNTFITWTVGVRDNVLATALSGDLPPLTGEALNFIRANATEDGGEFRTPAQVLSDIGATAALALKAPLAGPTFTGVPVAPTPASATNTTQIATTAYTRLAIPNVLNAAGSAPLYGCRAWVNFEAIGSVSIQASGNVSSITDNGVGSYTVNFTTAMQDSNYATIGSAQREGSTDTDIAVIIDNNSSIYSTTQVKIRTQDFTAVNRDCSIANVAIFR